MQNNQTFAFTREYCWGIKPIIRKPPIICAVLLVNPCFIHVHDIIPCFPERFDLSQIIKNSALSFTAFRLLTDFVCLYNYEFWLSLYKIVRSSVILLLPLFGSIWLTKPLTIHNTVHWSVRHTESFRCLLMYPIKWDNWLLRCLFLPKKGKQPEMSQTFYPFYKKCKI
jgi:hypothetical protein